LKILYKDLELSKQVYGIDNVIFIPFLAIHEELLGALFALAGLKSNSAIAL
jgi:hypothetical protein